MNTEEILESYKEAISLNASLTGLPERLIAAVIQVESAGNAHAIRFEPSFYTMVQREGFKTPAGVSKPTELNARCFWGCRQLAKCRDRYLATFGWAAVTAAYNGGFGAVKKDGSFTNPHYPKAVLAALGGSWPE